MENFLILNWHIVKYFSLSDPRLPHSNHPSCEQGWEKSGSTGHHNTVVDGFANISHAVSLWNVTELYVIYL